MMGFSKKKTLQADSNTTNVESESKKWVIAGISVRSLKPINTKGRDRENEEEEDDDEEGSITPTAKESRIPEKLPCPMAPRKRRTTKCNNNNFNGVIQFFTPPDLETVFKFHVEKAI